MNRIQEEAETGRNSEPWQELDHIQYANGVTRIDFYKAILMVEGQPIEFSIDTGCPVTIVPPRISPNDTQLTTKCTQAILGLNWLDKLEIGLQGSKNTNIIRNVINDEKREK